MNHSNKWKTLRDLLPLPAKPIGLKNSWESVESNLGVVLPQDYKKFVDLYGTGSIVSSDGEVGSLVVWNLRSVADVVKWVSSASRRYEDDRSSGYEIPFASYPDPNGLLAWGTTPAGDFFNWRMRSSKEWDVVFYHFSTTTMVPIEGEAFLDIMVDLLQQSSDLMPSFVDPDDFSPPCTFAEERW